MIQTDTGFERLCESLLPRTILLVSASGSDYRVEIPVYNDTGLK